MSYVHNVLVGETVEAKIGGEWQRATVTWVGEWAIYVERNGRHKINRFASTLRKVP